MTQANCNFLFGEIAKIFSVLGTAMESHLCPRLASNFAQTSKMSAAWGNICFSQGAGVHWLEAEGRHQAIHQPSAFKRLHLGQEAGL